MAYTSHGHHVPGTVLDDISERPRVRRCGGPRLCKNCSAEAAQILFEIRDQLLAQIDTQGVNNMSVTTAPYVRKPFRVDAVQVTAENMAAVADWCNGNVRHTAQGEAFVKVDVHKALTSRQTRAFAGDWVLFANRGFKVYTKKAFEDSFQPADADQETSDA